MRKRAVLTGAVLGTVFLALSMKGVDFAAVRAHFAGFSLWHILPATASLTCEFIVRTFRWRLLVTRAGYRPSFLAVYSSLFLGSFFSSLIPMRLGEIVRAYLLGRRQPGLRMSTILATILVERLADAGMLLLILLSVVLFHPLDPIIRAGGMILAAVLLAALGASAFMHYHRARTLHIFGTLLKPLGASLRERIVGMVDHFSRGFDIFSDPAKLWGTLFFTIADWILIITTCRFLMDGSGIPGGVVTAVVFLTAVGVISFLPSLPGLLGNIQIASVLVLGLQGISQSMAFSFSFIFQLFAFLYLIPVGSALLIYEGITPAQVLSLPISRDGDSESPR